VVIDVDTCTRVEVLLCPKTEAEAAKTEEFRRMIQADGDTWTKYSKMLTRRGPVENVVPLIAGAC
jgi:hypothetical protein